MNANLDRLFNLLPLIYRQRDAENGGQLKALLRVIAEQVNVVETDIAQLYENWFIETCQDWVVPYIGDLVGYQAVQEAGEAATATTLQAQQLDKILISRRDVANTIHFRRRKGTLALLEQLAWAVAGWPAHAVEYYKLVGITQNTHYPRSERGKTVTLRDSRALENVGGPFVQEAHTVDVRRITSAYTPGRYNLSSVGLFIWRLNAYSVTKTQALSTEDDCYTFSILGNDVPLYTKPQQDHTPVSALNFPGPISRQAFKKHLTDYYGPGKSIQIWATEALDTHEPVETHHEHREPEHPHVEHVQHIEHVEHFDHHKHHGHQEQHDITLVPGHPAATSDPEPSVPAPGPGPGSPPITQGPPPVAPERIVAADLSGWTYRPAPGKVAVDPVLGRIAFPVGHQPSEVLVSYYYGFSTDMGGGEYQRPVLQPTAFQLFQVGKQIDTAIGFRTLREALNAWNTWKGQHPESHSGVIEIIDNGVYTEPLGIDLEENESLHIRAANGQRPVLRLLDWEANVPNILKVSGERGSRFTLDGLLITGHAVQIAGDVTGVHIRHCTFVPGWGLNSTCEPHQPTKPSLELFNSGECVTIEQSILGAILCYENEAQEEPLNILISDSIIDATGNEHAALCRLDDHIAYALLTIKRCTVFGKVYVDAIELAENTLFNGLVKVARRQRGCMRFCSIPPGSRTPRRYHCQPDLVEQAASEKLKKKATLPEGKDYERREQQRVQPIFHSRRYGKPTYSQLALDCAIEITSGADDESEMGVFHDLYAPQRAANLRARLDDYTPAGVETGIIYVS